MITVRPDTPELLSEVHILINILRLDNQPETRKQNLDRMERIVDLLETSIEESESGVNGANRNCRVNE